MSEQMLENGLLYGLQKPSSYASLEEESIKTINDGLKKHQNASMLFKMLQEDEETNTLLSLANYIAVRKLGYNDHGPVHARIVTANGVRILRIILDSKEPQVDSVSGLGMSEDDAHLIVVAGCFLHDIGNAVHREEHDLQRDPRETHSGKAPSSDIPGHEEADRGDRTGPALALCPRCR